MHRGNTYGAEESQRIAMYGVAWWTGVANSKECHWRPLPSLKEGSSAIIATIAYHRYHHLSSSPNDKSRGPAKETAGTSSPAHSSPVEPCMNTSRLQDLRHVSLHER
ncbi:unnamed protein product [Ostreobium quekettii]|uniref:Uncharacterized protein n=1 Tax=Ostreobium quekettii TaxID=121088 RepID=A0A8S1IPN6_9CHLO|nr:unnamed protein product [Ostreobium quekettii]